MKQITLGTKIESEHKSTVKYLRGYVKQYGQLPPNKTIFRKIASDHLKENKHYYTSLRRAKL